MFVNNGVHALIMNILIVSIHVHKEMNISCRATSRINGVVYHPWSDGDLAELKKVSKLGSKFEGEQSIHVLYY